MQTIKTCNLSDEYKHVCFKDLEDYIAIDKFVDVLNGYSDLELAKIRQALQVPNNIKVDDVLNPYSTNPVENDVIYNALTRKADINKLARVAMTGNYEDLNNTPCKLPNPDALVIKGYGQPIIYDGNETVVLEIPTSVKDLKDWELVHIDYDKIKSLVPIKNIAVNNVIVPPNECGVVNLQVLTLKELNDALADLDFPDIDLEVVRNMINQAVGPTVVSYIVEHMDDFKGNDGATGPKGSKGDSGKSAYQSYLDTTTDDPVLSESEWIASLHGADGTVSFDDLTDEQKRQLKGDPGPQGPTGPQGEKGDPGIKGNDGAQGARGQDGDDAYTIAVKNGYIGSVTKWLEDLKGTPGKDGVDGKDGADGEPGASGRGITNVLEYYLASSLDSGVTRETSGWSTQIPTLTNINKYLWNYEVINYSSGNPSYTEPAIIGVYGNDGRGIVQVKEYYLATSLADGVTRETPGWTESIQTITPVKKYLWNYEEIIYDSGEPTYTDPVIIGAYGEKGDPGEEFDPYNFDDWSQLEYFSNLALQVKNNKEAIAAIGTGAQYCVPCTAEDNPEDCTLCEEGDQDCLEEYGQYGRKCTTISQAFAEFETKWGGSIAQIQSETQICYDSNGNIVDPDDEEAEVDHCVANNKAFLNLVTTVNGSIANLEANYYKKDDVDGRITNATSGLLLKADLNQAIADLNAYYTKQEADNKVTEAIAGFKATADRTYASIEAISSFVTSDEVTGMIQTSTSGFVTQNDIDSAIATMFSEQCSGDNCIKAAVTTEVNDQLESLVNINAQTVTISSLERNDNDNIKLVMQTIDTNSQLHDNITIRAKEASTQYYTVDPEIYLYQSDVRSELDGFSTLSVRASGITGHNSTLKFYDAYNNPVLSFSSSLLQLNTALELNGFNIQAKNLDNTNYLVFANGFALDPNGKLGYFDETEQVFYPGINSEEEGELQDIIANPSSKYGIRNGLLVKLFD